MATPLLIHSIKPSNQRVFVAYAMNGAPLPPRHGYPARILTPGLFGLNSVKWVTRVEVLDHHVKGFYEEQGWGPSFVIPNRSTFFVGDFEAPFTPGAIVPIRGNAFAGNRGVAQCGRELRWWSALAARSARLSGHRANLGLLDLRLATASSLATTCWWRERRTVRVVCRPATTTIPSPRAQRVSLAFTCASSAERWLLAPGSYRAADARAPATGRRAARRASR